MVDAFVDKLDFEFAAPGIRLSLERFGVVCTNGIVRIALVRIDFYEYTTGFDKCSNAVDMPVGFCLFYISGDPDDLA